MGRKQRKNRRKDDHSDDEDQEEEAQEAPKESKKELDFAQRRELQRQQAALKRRAKMKCYLCGKAGHVRRECPGVQDDGRGMSRYKNKSNAKKYVKAKKYGTPQESDSNGTSAPLLDYPEALHRQQDFCYYDVSCDIQATLEYCRQGRGKMKISQKEALAEYQQAIVEADLHTNFGGLISKTLLKPNRPWIQPEGSPSKTWYMLGLARDFLYNDVEEEAAIQSLVDTTLANHTTIVGFWAVLDYTPEYCQRPGCDRESQWRRVKATCRAAQRARVTVQLQLLPGAAGLDDVAGTDYAQVLLDLQSWLAEVLTIAQEDATLQIVLADWAGLSQHMLAFLQAFPNNLYIGLSGAVSFGKAAHLHECAFEIPLNRLVLETATIIPAEIANALGRDAFFHSGLWPFVAQAVAHYKKTVSIEEVARATSQVTLKLYPQLAASQQQSSALENEPGEGSDVGDAAEQDESDDDEVDDKAS